MFAWFRGNPKQNSCGINFLYEFVKLMFLKVNDKTFAGFLDFFDQWNPLHYRLIDSISLLPVYGLQARQGKNGVNVPGYSRAILTLPNLQALNWVQGYGSNEPIMQWLPLIKKIQEAGKSVIVDLKMNKLDEFMKKVDPTGIMLWIPAEPSEQKDILERVRRW